MADPIAKLVQQLSRLPGIGERTASRLAFHLVRGPKENLLQLASALTEVAERVRLCDQCMYITEGDRCSYCRDATRDQGTICVVSGPSDVAAIDRGGHFRGVYHVLHGVLSPLDGIGPDDLRIRELVQRIAPDSTSEVIIATAANVEGEATAMYLSKLVKPLGVEVSRISTGIPVGGELEYSDQATIAKALGARRPL